MILTKEYIQNNRDKFVLEDVQESQFAQNSIDLSLGEYIFLDRDTMFFPEHYKTLGKRLKTKNNKTYYKIKLYRDYPFILYPGMFALAYTDEWVGTKAGSDICWQFLMKSTPARNGLDHALAGWVEQGYFLPLCLELHSHTPVALRHGDLIGQAVFHTATPGGEDYSIKGSYQSSNNLEELKKTWKPEDILPKAIKNKFDNFI